MATIPLKNDAETLIDDLAGDTVSGNFVATSKITLGDATVDDGFVSSANPMPVAGAVTVSGVSTAANQTTGNASLSSIDTKTPALGQALAAASVPVVLTAAQLATITPPSAITGFATEVTLAAIASTGIPITGTVTVGTHAVTQSGTWTVTGAGGTFPVTDSGGSLTVDAPVGTPAFVRLSDGSAAISTLPVSLATVPSHAVTNAGTFAVQVDGPGLTRLTDIETNTDSGAVIGNGAAATAQRVTLANDSTGVLGAVSTVTTLTGGGIAHDSADSGNPHKIGAKAETALSGITLVADGDRTDLYAGVDGVLIVRPTTNLEDIVRGNANNTDGTSTQVIAASGSASIKTYLTDITLTNTSSSMIYVEIKSGTTVMYTCPVPATGGFTKTFNPPLPPNAANEAWSFDASAATTTLYASAIGFKSKV